MRKNDPRYDITIPEIVELRLTAMRPGQKRSKTKAIFDKLHALRRDYYTAIDSGNPRKLKRVLNKGFPVNFQNPRTGETALHRLAGSAAHDAIRVLMTHKDCNYLIRDKQGRLSSELAFLYGRDPALARLLAKKESKQAQKQGIALTRRPVPSAEPAET